MTREVKMLFEMNKLQTKEGSGQAEEFQMTREVKMLLEMNKHLLGFA